MHSVHSIKHPASRGFVAEQYKQSSHSTHSQHPIFVLLVKMRCSGRPYPLPHSVKISALALLKMAMHAKSGGNLEIMGMLQGKIINDTFIILGACLVPKPVFL